MALTTTAYIAPAIPLSRAVICGSCDVITEYGEPHCPSCLGEQLWPMARWLDRERPA